MLLERIFTLEKCPGRELCQELATRLKVRPRQVQVWFQNRRQRTKSGGSKSTTPSAGALDESASKSESERRADLLVKVALACYRPPPIRTASCSCRRHP